MKRSNKKGFTLVELLVVIAIIAIIAAVAVPVTIGQVNKAKTKTAEREIASAMSVAEAAITDIEAGTAASGETFATLVVKGLPGAKYVATVTVNDGEAGAATIVLTMKPGAPTIDSELLTKTLQYKVTIAANNVATLS